MQSNSFVILSLISLFVLSGAVSTMPTNEYGPIPKTFCDPVDFEDMTLLGTDVKTTGDTVGLAGGFPFTLTPNDFNKKGGLWYKNPINLYNGFVSEFTLSFDLAQQCVDSRCGGEGIAFVIQQTGLDAIGNAGPGMGYAGLRNVLAVEFDTMYDAQSADPSTALERHISIIVKKDTADASEVNAIAMNTQPLNFKNDKSENYMTAPVARVEYLNNNLRVFINDVLQLAYYYPLNLVVDRFQTANPLFYVGFTASTGATLAQMQLVQFWRLAKVQSDADSSKAVIVTAPANIVAGQNFEVKVTINDRCSNFFYTNDVSKLQPAGFGDFNQTCKVVSVKSIIETSLPATNVNFNVVFNCTLSKENYVNFKWFNDGAKAFRDLAKQPIKVLINAAPLSTASIIWTDYGYMIATNGQSPKVDANTPLRFTVVPRDAFGNEVAVDQAFIDSITVAWPDKTSNKAKVSAPVIKANRLTFTITVDAAGEYVISSKWFTRTFVFTVEPGVVSAANSIAYLGDAVGAKATYADAIKAGSTDVFLYLVLRDRASNLIPVNVTNIDNQVDAYGVDWDKRVLNNSYVVLSDSWGNSTILQNNTIINVDGSGAARYSARPYRAGTVTFQAWVRGVQVPLKLNSITIIPGDFCGSCTDSWKYVEVWPFNTQTGEFYRPTTPDSIIIVRKGLFKTLVIATDIYFNPIYKTTPYTLTLAGELMYPITMCGSAYNTLGTSHSLCASTGREVDNYNSLVQRSNYSLYVNDTSGNVVRKVQVYLVTYVDDNNNGNGPWIPENTVIWNWDYKRTAVRCTDSTADESNVFFFGIATLNAEKKRTNRWFVKAQNIKIVSSITAAKSTEQFIVRQADWRGIYIITYISQSVDYAGNGRKFSVGIDKSEIYAGTGLGVWPDEPTQYKIKNGGARLLADSTATTDFISTLFVANKIYPNVPAYGYIVSAQGTKVKDSVINAFGNFTAGITVDTPYVFTIALFDAFGNPTWYETPNWFKITASLTKVQFQNTFDAYNLAPQCNPTAIVGIYNCTLFAIKAGEYTIASPIFKNRLANLGFDKYTIYLAPGKPTVATSYAELDLTGKTYFLATETVKFYITPKDQYLNLLSPDQTIYDNLFELLYQLPNNVSNTPTNVMAVADAATGRRIQYTIQVNMSGITIFKPTLSKTPLGCTYCSVTVKPNVPNWAGCQMQMLIDGKWTKFDPTQALQLDNFNKVPSFYLAISDIAGNLVGEIPKGWQNFKATIKHPRVTTPFSLNGLPYQNGVNFALDQIYVKAYSLLVWDNTVTMSFEAHDGTKTVSIPVNNVTTLGQGSEADSKYDNADIDISKSTVTPSTITVKAGTIASFNVETRTSNGKLKKAFYDNGIAGNIELDSTYFFQSHDMVRGTSYGTYTVNFNITNFGVYAMRIRIKDSTGKQGTITQSVTVNVVANDVYTVKFVNRSGLVLNSSHFYERTVDDTIQFIIQASDFWKNPIYDAQQKSLGLAFSHSSNANANFGFTLKKAAGSNFVVALTPRTVGDYHYQYIDLSQPGGVIDLILPVAVGNPSPTDSVAEVQVNKIKPASDAFIYVYPTDKFGNNVGPSVVNERFPTTTFMATIQYPGATGNIVTLGKGSYDTKDANAKAFYWKAANLTQAGDYTFTTYFGDSSKQTKYTSRIVTVEANDADFFSMNLNVKSPSTNGWSKVPRVADPAKNETAPKPIVWDPVAKPNFQMDLRDRYGNQIAHAPSNWNLTLSLTNLNNTQAERIYFCYDHAISFYFCAKNESQQPKIPGTDPNLLWAQLVTTHTYYIELSKGDNIFQAVWTFVPNPSDDSASVNRLDVAQTVISPQTRFTTVAGQAFTFNVEMRATDGKRKKMILEDPSQNLTLQFAQDNNAKSFTYKVSNGQLPGQYVVTVTPFKTYTSIAPNQLTVVFDDARYTGYQPFIISTPAKVQDVFVQGFYGLNNKQIGAATVDSKYQFTIQAVDIYNNTVPLTDLTAASVKVVSPKGEAVSVSGYVFQNSFITYTFQPTVVGAYRVEVDQRHNYTVAFTYGIPSSDYTSFTTKNTNQIAGVENQLIVTVVDQFGNKVPVDANLAKNFTGFFNMQNDFERYVLMNPTFADNTVTYKFTPNVTGIYEFSFAYKNKEAICKSCSAMVSPAALSFANTTFQYYSTQAGAFVAVNPSAPVVEDNRNSLPLYGLVLRDVYGNALGVTPSGYSMNVTLTGTNATVQFNTTIRADGTMVFDLPVEDITVGGIKKSVSDYWADLLYTKDFYTLSFNDGSKTYNHSIVIKGNGDNDLDASNLDFSIANTVISTTTLSTVAHQFVSFVVETRTTDNRRKSNNLNAVIKVTFDQKDASDNFTVIPSDKPGVYVVSVITNKAYKLEDQQYIGFSINGSDYAKKISLVVVPAPLYYSVIVESTKGALATINATERMSFSVVGTDEYRNVIDGITADTVNLQIYRKNAPENRVNPKFEFTQTKNSVQYSVDATYIGDYLIASPMFKDPMYYNFTIIPARGSAPNSILTVSYGSELPLRANTSVQVILSVYDQYDNMHIGSDIDFGAFNITLIGSTGVSYVCKPTTKAHWQFINCTVYPTVADDYTVVVQVYGQAVPSSGYTLSINPGPIDIKKTAFFKDVANGLSIAVPSYSVAYETEGFQLEAKFRDYWNNSVKSFDATDAFTIQLYGNDMNTMSLVENRVDNSTVRFSTTAADAPWFKRLVNGTGYNVFIVYSRDGIQRGNATLPFAVEGELSADAGNGNYDLAFTNVSSTTINSVAGYTTRFLIELRTKANKRYNGPIAEDTVIVKSTNGDNTGIAFSTVFTGTNGIWVCTINSTRSFRLDDQKFLNIFVEGKDVQRYQLQLVILPDFPRLFTLVTANYSGKVLPENKPALITFKLSDKYGNQYTDSTIASKITPHSSSGNVDFGVLTQGGNNFEQFNLNFIPYFPPLVTDVDILLAVPGSDPSQNALMSVLGAPFTFNISSEIDPKSTDIIGSEWTGIPVDSDMDFTVLVRNKKLYCIADDANVTVIFHGPYANYALTNKTLSTSKFFNFSAQVEIHSLGGDKMGSNQFIAKACTKYYTVHVPAGTLQKAGIYQMEISVNQWTPIIKRQTVMRAGQISVQNTEALIPTGYGNAARGKTEISMVAADTFSFQIQLFDKFDNIVTYDNGIVPAAFSFADAALTTADYSYTILNNRNGSYAVVVNITKEGTYNKFQFFIHNTLIDTANMYNTGKLNNFPGFIQVTPGYCSDAFPKTPKFDQFGGIILVGRPNSFYVQCADRFNNLINITKSEAQFTVTASGTELDTVGTDTVYPTVAAVAGGLYEVTFTTAWSGNYTFRIQLRSAPYVTVTYAAQYSMCPTATPYFCSNVTQTGKSGCTSGPLECTFPGVTFSGQASAPFNCSDNSTVKALEQCPCSQGEVKSAITGKCAVLAVASSLFPDVADISCPEDTVKCDDGSCRINSQNCPSLRTCAPGYFLCPDLQCAATENECTASYSSCPPPGDAVRLFKCWDQSCASSVDSCPTRVTCPVAGQVFCEGVCVDTALDCRQPAQCFGTKALRCSDGSCANKTSDCPATKSCGYNQALCNDGTCREDCAPTVVASRIRRLSESDSASKYNNFVCPSGDVVPSQYNCPSSHVCGSGRIQCIDGSCVSEISQCPQSSCPLGTVECWDGKCETSINRCSTRTTCPEELPTLCSDGSCKSSASDCGAYVECPVFFPFRCGSGECRSRKEDCATLVTCPPSMPIKCADESCVRNKVHCSQAAATVCDAGSFRCGDGSCAASKSLCPTLVSCPAGMIRCWNNECKKDLAGCSAVYNDTMVCSTDAPIRCPDGSCRKRSDDCPTPVVCPLEKPVLCDDGNCRESSADCFKESGCNAGTKRCPDGSCVGATDACGTPITCPLQAPYKCLDMTCKRNPQDCPAVKECPNDTPIRCGDGTCVTRRIYCRALSACPANAIVRCPDMISCVDSRDKCSAIKTCPAGFVQCDDGSCSISALTCPTKSCPVHLSYKCPDGFCVSDKSFCTDPKTGCPLNTPTKCDDGSCVGMGASCPARPVCSDGQTLCADGSCSKSCAGVNKVGCSNDEIKCTNGQCVDPAKTQCPVASCPTEKPAKCLDGQCVDSLSNCHSMITKEDFSLCSENNNGNFVPCADGTCVASAEQCRPVLPKPALFVRCDDGSSRPTQQQCPVGKTCPKSRSYRCDSGVCAPSKNDCPSETNGCPGKFPARCQKTGQCISNKTEEVLSTLNIKRTQFLDHTVCNVTTNENGTVTNDCDYCNNVTDEMINQAKLGSGDKNNLRCEVSEDICNIVYEHTNLSNGCNFLKPFRCSNNTCVGSLSQCDITNSCPGGKFMCFDNTCADSVEECKNKSYDCSKNETHKFQCPDNKCAKDPRECLTRDACPVATPYKCGDGKCYSSPLSKNGEAGCSVKIQCPALKPYVCADGECVGDSKFCQIETPCPTGQVRCSDRSCVASKDKCDALRCPPKRPILCSFGACVEKAVACQVGNTICPSTKPYRCAVGVCVSSPAKCDMFTSTGTTIAMRRILERLMEDGTIVNPGCTAAAPVKCADGSCRKNSENCPLFTACNDPTKPYRCGDGSCSASKKTCVVQTPVCAEGLKACTDGICRQSGTCPAFDGCPLEKPLQCSNGYCASTLAECAGHSDCPLSTPFRCANNKCVSDMTKCARSVRTFSAEDMTITVSPITTTVFDFMTEPGTTRTHAALLIPSGALLPPMNDTTNGVSLDNMVIQIMPTPHSTLQNLTNAIDETRFEYTNELFPLSEAKLGFYQSVRSAVFTIDAVGRNNTIQYRFPIYLTIDFESVSADSTDYCLGKVNGTAWNCLRSSVVSNSTTTFTFNLTTDGTYAVIYNPERREARLIAAIPTWWDQHKGQFFLWGSVSLVSLALFVYIFWRMARYVTKYRESKSHMKNFETEIKKLQTQNTDILGQSLRDKVEGIIFVVNPMHEKHEKPDLSTDIKEMEKALTKLDERDRQFEADNQSLVNRNKIMEKELSKLKEQFAK